MPIPDIAINYKWKRRLFRYLGFSLEWLIQNKMPWLANRMYQLSTNERIVEYPFVHSNIGFERGRILDVGCGRSKLPLELASQGYSVWCIDLEEYPFLIVHPYFNFVRGDICKAPFDDGFFDTVIAVSSIEHIGLEGDDDLDADKNALMEIYRVLKVGGKVILTVPFGRRTISYFRAAPCYRVYNLLAIKDVLFELEIEKLEYALKVGRNWVPAPYEEVKDIDSSGTTEKYEVKAVALVVASKTHR